MFASARTRRLARKREELRETLWPGASANVWSRHRDKGFTTIPRSLPLILRLISELTPKGDASSVYLDLWARSYDEGLLTVHDEQEMAFSAGYDGPRAARTWREHIDTLVDLGFIQTKELGNRDIGHILILDPHKVAAQLHATGGIPSEWWNAFVTRLNEVGATVPVAGAGTDHKK